MPRSLSVASSPLASSCDIAKPCPWLHLWLGAAAANLHGPPAGLTVFPSPFDDLEFVGVELDLGCTVLVLVSVLIDSRSSTNKIGHGRKSRPPAVLYSTWREAGQEKLGWRVRPKTPNRPLVLMSSAADATQLLVGISAEADEFDAQRSSTDPIARSQLLDRVEGTESRGYPKLAGNLWPPRTAISHCAVQCMALALFYFSVQSEQALAV